MFTDKFAEDGCLVIDRLFDPTLIDSVRDEYERQYSSFDPANMPLHLKVGNGRLQLPLQLRGPLLETDLYANPLLMAILSNILDTAFLIDNIICVTAQPSARDQRCHRDHPYLFEGQTGLEATLPPFAITVAIPLIDLGPETGTTKLFAGSTSSLRAKNGGPRTYSQEICPFVQRGGCFLMDYRLWHQGLANRSKHERPILYIIYARQWFTDVNNFKEHSRMSINLADARQVPIEHRQLFRRVAAKGLLDISMSELMAMS